MSKEILQVNQVTARVEDKEILHGVSLDIKKGETHVLMGPNGAGKSTLGYVLTGNPKYQVTQGHIIFNGEDMTETSADKRAKAGMFPKDEKYEKRMKVENAYMDDTAIKLGIFDQRCFYNAFAEFDNQDIETSLKSENLIVKIFAVLDRRVGKRRLKIMKETIMEEPDTFREFYAIRVKAEGLL